MRIERSRENVFTVTATSQELSALVAGARMALEAMRAAPEPPPREAVEILERVLGEFDLARERLAGVRRRAADTGGRGSAAASINQAGAPAAISWRMCAAIWSNSVVNAS